MAKNILNLTQHRATKEQVAEGVFDPDPEDWEEIRTLLTFEELPDTETILLRAQNLAGWAQQYQNDLGEWDEVEEDWKNPLCAMIGGAPYLMSNLEQALTDVGITPVYAFSKRESVETQNPDGTATKPAVFRHLGFVEVNL